MHVKGAPDTDTIPPPASTEEALQREVEGLRARTRELEETIDAIRRGEVDAIVVAEGGEHRVYSLDGAEHPYRVLVERIQEGAVTLTAAGLILFANESFARMLNRPLPDVLGTPFGDHIPLRDRERFAALLGDASTGVGRGELHVCSGTGTMPVALSLTPIQDGDRTTIGVVVTDRRQDHARLRLQGRMLDSVMDAVTAVDPNGTIIYWNAAAERLFGWTAAEMIGRTVDETFNPDLVEDERRFFERLLAGEAWSGEHLARHRDGRRFPVQASQAPVYDDDGTLVAIIGTSHDITERKQTETAMRESEARLRAVLDGSPDPIFLKDRESRLLMANPATFAVIGKPAEACLGRTDEEFYDNPADGRAIMENDRRIMASGLTESVEETVSVPYGPRYYLSIKAPYRDAAGTVIGLIGTTRDITDHKRFERALAESEADARSFIENLVDACAICETVCGADGIPTDIRMADVNHALARAMGLPPSAIVGRTAFELLPDLDPFWVDRFLEVGRTGAAVEIEEPFPAFGRWYRVVGFPVRGGRTAVLFRDITERKTTEEALRESEERLRLAQVSANVGVWDWDVRTGRQTYTPELLQLYGLAKDLIYDYDLWRAHVHPDDIERAERERDAALARGEPFDLEFRIVTPSGEVRWLASMGRGVYDDQGALVRVLGVNIDLTERKESELGLALYADRLTSSNEELQRFAYVASHDLQEPLRSIVSFSQLLERRYRGQLDADADEYIAFIVEGGNRMQRLIADLLQVSRVETQAKELVPTDAGIVVAGALAVLDPSLQETGATVTVGPLPTVMADAAQLEQVFMNLVSNAIKYRRPDVPLEIAISARRLDGMVEFAVADNGIGIEPEYFDRIFEMFRRLHTHDQYEGTGIGLAVVKKIVERHGGTIRVESMPPGEGSTFFFTLPAA
jgi:PAS domain S-box-containing protein